MQKSEPGSSPIDAPAGKPSHPSRFAISIADPLEDVNRAEKAEGSPAPHKTRVSTETVGSIRERAGEPSKSMIRERAVRVNTRFAAEPGRECDADIKKHCATWAWPITRIGHSRVAQCSRRLVACTAMPGSNYPGFPYRTSSSTV